jgi:hypothetical protein
MSRACSTHEGEMENAYKILDGKCEEKRPLGRIILKCFLGKYGGKVWIRSI